MAASVQVRNSPLLTEAPRRLALYKHTVVSGAQLQEALGSAFTALYARIGASGVATADAPFVIYHDESEPGVRWDIDICAPVSAPVDGGSEFGMLDIPAGRVVALLHVGPYEDLDRAYAAIEQYIAQKGLTAAGPPREFYLSGPDTPSSEIETLIERPVRSADNPFGP